MRQEAVKRSNSNTQIGRSLPNDLEAEEALLGAMLLSKEAIAEALEIARASDFYKPAHAEIFQAIIELYQRGEPVDTVTVADELKRKDLSDFTGGIGALMELQSNTPSIGSAAYYAKIVEEHAILRRLIQIANEIAEMGYSLPSDVAEVLDKAESLVFGVAERRSKDTAKRIYDLLSEAMDELEALIERGTSLIGVPTGFRGLDELLAGLQKSNLIIVGARPSMGKTSFALGIALNVAVQEHKPVLIFSLEMSHMEITQRLLASYAKVDANRLRTGKLTNSEWQKISAAISPLGEAPIYIDDNPMVSVMDIRAKARRLFSKEQGLGLVIVDYLQLMTGREKAENRQVEVAEISRGLKILARELGVPVMALSQLSRSLEQRADKQPVLADLRESGSLEQDADVVMFIYREDFYDKASTEKGTADIIVAKHRNGPTGKVKLIFREQYTRFDDPETSADIY
jgi:replicative DNA helicase